MQNKVMANSQAVKQPHWKSEYTNAQNYTMMTSLSCPVHIQELAKESYRDSKKADEISAIKLSETYHHPNRAQKLW